nr:uncharacterized protein BN887_01577 [Melanopsichium pennsylvanicum 4]
MESKEQDQDLLVEAERKVSPGPSTAITQPPIKNEETPEKRAEHELRRSEQNQESDSFRAKPSSSTSSSFGRDYLSLQRAKYASSSAAKKDSYDALLNFQSRIRTKATRSSSSQPTASTIASLAAEKDDDDDDEEEEEEEEAREYGASDDDADADWRQHKLDAGGRPLGGADGKDRIDDYEVLDPRDHKSNTNGKGKGKGTDGQKGENRREGKRGRDWVDNDRRYSSYDKKGRRQDHVGDRAYKPSSSDDGRDKKYKARQSTDTHDRDRRNRVDHRR